MKTPDARINVRCIGCGISLSPTLHIMQAEKFDADGYLKREFTQPVCAKCAKWWCLTIYLLEAPQPDPPEEE